MISPVPQTPQERQVNCFRSEYFPVSLFRNNPDFEVNRTGHTHRDMSADDPQRTSGISFDLSSFGNAQQA